MNKNGYKSKCKINKIDVTNDTLTGRGGMALFVRDHFWQGIGALKNQGKKQRKIVEIRRYSVLMSITPLDNAFKYFDYMWIKRNESTFIVFRINKESSMSKVDEIKDAIENLPERVQKDNFNSGYR